MTLFTYLETNAHLIKNLMALNVVPVSIIFHLEVYRQYLKDIEQEPTKTIAIGGIAERFKISERQVFRIVGRMEQEVEVLKSN